MPRRTPPPPGARWIKLTKGKWALVDERDFLTVTAAGPWHLYTPSKSGGKRKRKTRYARKVFYANGRKVSEYLHRWLWHDVWRLPFAEHIDHVGGDGLDCRRSKLRAATPAQNQRARSYKNQHGLKGVVREHNRFVARITADGHRRVLGRFDSAADAAAAYDRAARELHGEFARTNFGDAA